MDFFEAQARAKKRTSRLLLLFVLAVVGTIGAAYFSAIFGLRAMGAYEPRHRGEARYRVERFQPEQPLWQPDIFGAVAIGTVVIVGLASLYKWHEYSSGGRAVAENLGGRRVDPQTTNLNERRLLNVVEEMAIASGTPVPAVYIMDEEPAINAFAAGLTTSDAVVAVTRGTLEKLTRDELQGVIGHEFSHILNGDMRLNLRIAATVFGILVIGLAGRGILWSLRHTRVRSDRKSGGGMVVAIIGVGVALLIIGYVGYFFGRIIQAAVSRQREFLADASAVQFTRNPGGLSGALKKIGGYALGSKMLSANSAAVGHFFFAQAFRSGFTGLWSTHPPLPERIRAIDPQFDGAMFEPAEVVDVAQESFVTAGLAPAATSAHLSPPPLRPRLTPGAANEAVRAVGTLTPEQIGNAQLLLDSTPGRLRDAAHDSREAPVLVFAILLSADAAVRSRQRNFISQHGGADALRILDDIEPALGSARDEHKLPLLQLALPQLRQISPQSLDAFLDTLDQLVHADEHVSTFEFALQKLLIRTLELGRAPGAAVVQYHSFHAVADEIATVLSALAHAATSDASSARQAFQTGVAELKLIESKLQFRAAPAADLNALDTALDKLARASGPIKQRTLVAAAHVVGADGQLLVTEAELLRAISAALDCPMPLLNA
jgi:Zn-dependent protease with chaperone function